MEVAKILLYSGRQLGANLSFATFASVFLTSRWLLYPMLIVIPAFRYALSAEGIAKRENVPGWQVSLGGLLGLQALHVFWGVLIVKMVVQAVTEKSVKGDIRDEE